MENVPAGPGQGGYDDFYTSIINISDRSSNGIGFLTKFSYGGWDHDQSRDTYGEGMIFHSRPGVNNETGYLPTRPSKSGNRPSDSPIGVVYFLIIIN